MFGVGAGEKEYAAFFKLKNMNQIELAQYCEHNYDKSSYMMGEIGTANFTLTVPCSWVFTKNVMFSGWQRMFGSNATFFSCLFMVLIAFF